MKGWPLAVALVAGALSGCVAQPDSQADEPYATPQALLLHPAFARVIHVEVDYMPGAEPDGRVLATFHEIARETTGKEVILHAPTAIEAQGSADKLWSAAEIEDLAAAERDHGNTDSAQWMHVLYLRGLFDSEFGPTTGVTIDGTAFVFPDHLRTYVASVDGRGPAQLFPFRERFVLMHEVGHVFGLVDCGIPMVTPRLSHTDAPCHSDREGSVMFSGNESLLRRLDPLELVLDNSALPYRFDEFDLQDIRAFQALSVEDLEARGHWRPG